MHRIWVLLLGFYAISAQAQDAQPLEIPSTPFDFDNYRRTPMQARQTSVSWASRNNSDLQRALISGEKGKTQEISVRAAALFENPAEIPVRPEPEPVPTPNELTDEITSQQFGETTKGQKNLLARGRVAKDLDLSSMSESDYELYVSSLRLGQEQETKPSGEALLRPMPSLVNSKTGGPPHAYAVSQAGVGARSGPRNDQNPFDDLIRALRLDHPVTKGTDPLPSPAARLAATPSVSAPLTETAPTAAPESSGVQESSP